MGRVRLRTSTKRALYRELTGWLRGLPPQGLCKDVIPWEFPLLFSQGYDSAAFSVAALMAGMIVGAGPRPTIIARAPSRARTRIARAPSRAHTRIGAQNARFEHVLF